MPLPLAGIAMGAGIAESVTNPLFAHLTNVKNRKFAREQYKTQRQDALSDWAMQNEYNSPRMQMQRYQEAGLNPHLIYGQSNEGAVVRSSSASTPSGQAPQSDISSKFMQAYDMKRTSAQTDLVAKQMQLMDEDIGLRKAQQWATVAGAGKTTAETDQILFDLGLKKDLRETTIEGKQADVESTKAHTGVLLERNEREAAMNAKSVEEAAERILAIRLGRGLTSEQITKVKEEISLIRKEGRIKELDASLADRGIRPADSILFRYLGGIIEGLYKKFFGEEWSHPDRRQGETLEEFKRRKAIGKHQ